MSSRLRQRVVTKTADYTIVDEWAGTLFTNRGAAGAVVFTLPTPAKSRLGDWYEFHSVVAQDLTVAGRTAGDVLALNDVTANSLAASTNNEKIGARIRVQCIETSAAGVYKWAASGIAVGHTYTIAT